MNRYTEGLIKIIVKYGGDIIKFVGDAMIIVWPPPIAKSPEYSRLSHDEDDPEGGTLLE